MEEQKQKNWFERNWLWVVPVGGCLTLILLVVFGLGAALFGGYKMLNDSEPYNLAIEEASNNEMLISILGEPIETDGIMEGTLNYNNGRSSADMSIPLKGPNGKASVYIKGVKEDDDWIYEHIYVIVEETNDRIEILDGTSNDF